MRRALIAAPIVAALVLAPAAEAHVTVTPTRVAPGVDVVLQFAVPDERSDTSIVDFAVRAPSDLVLEEVETPSGWRAMLGRSSVRWTAGRITPRHLQTFRVQAFARRAGVITLDARIRYANGGSETYHPRAIAGGPVAGSAHGGSAHSLAKWALFVAIAAAALALAAWIVALRGWLKHG